MNEIDRGRQVIKQGRLPVIHGRELINQGRDGTALMAITWTRRDLEQVTGGGLWLAQEIETNCVLSIVCSGYFKQHALNW
jgi:hypothetical protein